MLAFLGSLIVLAGAAFLFLAGVGIVRMPDSYNRIQAGTKATTLGVMLVLLGVSVMHPLWAPKLVVLILFVIITNSVSSHALARAAHHKGIFRAPEMVMDKLEETEQRGA